MARNWDSENSLWDLPFPPLDIPFLLEEETSPAVAPTPSSVNDSTDSESSFDYVQAFAGSETEETSGDTSRRRENSIQDVQRMNCHEQVRVQTEYFHRTEPCVLTPREVDLYSIDASETDTSESVCDPLRSRFGLSPSMPSLWDIPTRSRTVPTPSSSPRGSPLRRTVESMDKVFEKYFGNPLATESQVAVLPLRIAAEGSSEEEIEQGPEPGSSALHATTRSDAGNGNAGNDALEQLNSQRETTGADGASKSRG